MNTLKAIVARGSVPAPVFPLDHFQRRVLDNLHLEFFLERCRVLIRPDLRYFTTGESTREEEALLQALLEDQRDLLGDLKLYLLYNFSLYSSLLETNSYYISVNDHLLISRFLGFRSLPGCCEVKLYTLRPQDLPANYEDKIYLGRDLLSLDTPRREHLGLGYIRDSLGEQVQKLRARVESRASDAEKAALGPDSLKELDELVEEFCEKSQAILECYPRDMSADSLAPEVLLEVNRVFRDLKHVLFDMEESLREMEKKMFESRAPRAVRYVTKLRKDVSNDINYIMLKVNGRISDFVNQIRI